MKLFVGLGNPGADHALNRHNVGFMAVDAIAAFHNFPAWRKRFQGFAAEGRLAGEPVLLLKPATYMNESGRSVGEAIRFYKLKLEDVIVFHDELDLAPGKVRVKTGGGVAGHNGLKSLTAHIGNDYVRVRIGIGHPGHRDLVVKYVLRNFTKSDHAWLETLLGAIAEDAPYLAEGAYDRFQSHVAHAMQNEQQAEPPPKPARPRSRRDKEKRVDASAKIEPAKHEGSLAGMLRRWLGSASD